MKIKTQTQTETDLPPSREDYVFFRKALFDENCGEIRYYVEVKNIKINTPSNVLGCFSGSGYEDQLRIYLPEIFEEARRNQTLEREQLQKLGIHEMVIYGKISLDALRVKRERISKQLMANPVNYFYHAID